MSNFKKDFLSWVHVQSQEDGKIDPEEQDWLKEFQVNPSKSEFSFQADLTFTEEFRPITVTVPDAKNGYPKGVYKYNILNLAKTFRAESLEEAMEEILEICEDKREIALNNLVTPTPIDPESPWANDDDIWGETTDEGSVKEVQTKIAKDIAQFKKNNRNNAFHVVAGACGNNQCWIYLLYDPKKHIKISSMTAAAWGLDLNKFVTVSLTFTSLYTSGNQPPKISSFQSGTNLKKLDGSELSNKTPYGTYWTVENRIKREFMGKYWPLSEKYDAVKEKRGFLTGMLEMIEDTVKHCCGRCLICSKELVFEGVKPVVCDGSICQFSHEQFGLGVNIETELKNNPDIVDLMITMGYAACSAASSKFNPFNPYPSGLNAKIKTKGSKQETQYDFKRSNPKDNSKVKTVLEKLPKVATMVEMVKKGTFKAEMFKLHPLAYSLIRWLMASNRCHLRRLKKQEEIKAMNTKFQYVLLSSTPEKQERFRKLKQKYGTVWAFHGSALCNWHAIMRIGLKNMSGTPGQVNGAAYGSGVYLANDSGTSFSYIRYQAGWKNSMFGSSNLGVMACCEIVKHADIKGMPNPYYVIKNDELLSTRYFFVYPGSGSANVNGKTLKPPPLIDE